MPDQNQPLDYYEILGVSHDAPADEIQRAYRRLAMEWHPDRNRAPDAPQMMRLINAAWETLGDPDKRADYDRGRPGSDGDFEQVLNWYRSELLPWLLENAVDLYDILGVSHNATFEEIQEAHELRQRFIADDPVLRQDPRARDRIRYLLLDARIVLSHPQLRAEYDQHYFLLRSKVAEAARRAHEEERREREKQHRERQREQARREAEIQRQREDAERRRRREDREARERKVREDHERREREHARNVRCDSDRHQGVTPRPRERRPTGINGFTKVAVSIILVGVGFAFVLLWFNRAGEPPTSETVRSSVIATRTPRPSPPPPRPTATPVPRVAVAPPAKPTSSPIVKPTATYTAVPTATIVPNPTAIPTPKPTPTRIPTSAPTRTSVSTQPRNIETFVAYGPRNGTLINGSDSGRWFDSNTDFGDFLAEVVFTIPVTIVGDHWIGGVIIRANGSEADLVGIVSNGDWFHSRQSGTGWETQTQGYSPVIDTTPGGKNRVQVTASGKTGWLSINGGSPIELELDGAAQSGTVVLASYADSGTSLTSFSGFSVRPFNADQESITVLVVTPSPAPKATAVPTPTATKSALAQPTATLKPTWTGSNTVLHDLLYRSDATTHSLKVLIDAGAPLDTTDGYGDTPLEVAVKNGHSDEIIQAIIDAGANLSEAERVLHDLLYRGDATTHRLKVLIDAGAPLNATDGYGDTPLEVAVKNGHSDEIVRMIISAGARLSEAERVLHDLLYRGDATVRRLKMLIDAGAPLDTTDGYGDTPLEVAVGNGHSDQIVQAIIDAGADMSKAERVLHDLLYRGDATTHRLKVLIDARAPLNATDGYGDTPLEVAVKNGHSDQIVQSIIDAGADMSKAERVLHDLLYRGDATVRRLKMLIDAGASLDTRDGYGDTPLEVAVGNRHSDEIIQIIIAAMNR